MNQTQQLTEQNNGRSWRDCALAGLKHRLGAREVVASVYGSETHNPPTTVRRCKRCPVSIMSVPRG